MLTCRLCRPAVKYKKTKREISSCTLQGNRKNCGTCDGDNNCNWCAWYSHQRIDKGTGGFGNKRTSGDHPNYSIIEIDQNTEKSPGDFRRFSVTKNPMINHQLALAWKTLKRKKISIIRKKDCKDKTTLLLEEYTKKSNHAAASNNYINRNN